MRPTVQLASQTSICDASCTVERIKTHSNHSMSREIKWQLQLAACAAPCRTQELFVRRKNQEKSISIKIDVCNVCDASCTVERIETHSNHSTSMEIKWQLQLAACAAPGRPQAFFVRRKNQENRFRSKLTFATFATQVAQWNASKLTQIIPRAWKSSGSCNWRHAQLPVDHRHFSYAGKIKKNRFRSKLTFATFATQVARWNASKLSQIIPRA